MPFQNKCGKSNDCICGLVFYPNAELNDAIPVPLKKVNINAKIVDFVSEITVTQSYVNVESIPIQIIYTFPVEEEAAVTFFEAEVPLP